MGKERKKNEIMVESQGTVEEVAAERNPTKKKKKNRENKDNFSGEDGEIAARESEKLSKDALVKKKSKKERVNSEADDDVGRKSKKKSKEKVVDFEADDDVGRKSLKENEEIRADSEADDDGGVKKSKKKSKKKSGGDEKALVNTDEADKEKTGKRKRDDSGLGAEENTDEADKEVKRKSKKKKASVDSQVEENTLSSGKDAKKKQSENPEVEENNKDSTKDSEKKRKKKKQSEDPDVGEEKEESAKDSKKKQSEDSEAEGNDLSSKKVGKKKGKKKKQSEDREAEGNNDDGTKDATKKRKKKQKCSKSDEEVTTPSSKSAKKVKFSDQVEVFPTEDEGSEEEEEESEDEERVELVRGKRFTKEEDELIKKAVYEYIDKHALGEEGVNMVLTCRSHPEIRGCWKEIATALPWRPLVAVYHRAHSIFEEGSKGIWTKEDFALVMDYYTKNGSGDWKALADAMGKNRKHVKDAWRRIRLASKNRGHWSREEYQTLFDLVNKDLRMKVFQEKREQHGMLRDNIPWMVISDQLKTRDHTVCCLKWYDKLTSPMVAKGMWANVDDYRLLDELTNLDAACVDDVDWESLLDNRDGETCRKRWDQMVRHIGLPGTKTFAEEVEILSQRYCPDIAEDREDFDNRPFDPED